AEQLLLSTTLQSNCDFYFTNQFLTAKSVGQQANELRPRPIYDVFLGGSCGNTVWRRDLVIPYLEKRAISYYDPQRSVWNEHMINEESVAKENSNLFLFVLDPATVNATSFLEIAHFAARKAPKLVVVFLGQSEWKERAHPEDLPDRQRTCDLLDDILTMHDIPVLQSIQDALRYIDEIIIGEKAGPKQCLIRFKGFHICSYEEGVHVGNQLITYEILYEMLKMALKLDRPEAKSNRNLIFLAKAILSTVLSRIGLFEILLLLAVYFFLRTLPLILLLIPFLAFDVFVALFSAIYYCYKINAAARRRAKLVNAAAISLPIPGHAVVPCNIVAQQIPLSYCYQSMNRSMHAATTSLPSRLLKKRSYDSGSSVTNPLRWINANGYDIFLGAVREIVLIFPGLIIVLHRSYS
ncbi:hypothetical protein WUBG_08352, partial [Wuchereria bancrofti]